MSIKYVLITIVGCWLFLQISGLIWSSKGQQPSETLARLLEPPLNHIADPSRNGYFYLLGLTAAPSLDPAWVGYDIWHEADAKPVTATFDYEQPGRSDVRLVVAGSFLAPVWDSDDPFNELRQREASLRAAVNQFNVLLMRYDRWLDMKFEDQGFGHRAVPRFEDVLLIHRLYLADGLSQRMALGMNRLQRDLTAWRTILREARTISLKVMAQVVIADDLKLLSKLFARPTVDKSLVPIATSLATPLTPSEYSLRWPVRSQLALGLHKERLSGLTGVGTESPEDMNEQWLLRAAAFAPEAFHRIDHPTPRSFLGIPLQTQRTWDTYASYYDTIISASESGHASLPLFRDVVRSSNRGLLENMMNSVPFAPEWDSFHYQLMETDARLRLASLQVVLRRPSAQITVPNRLAEVGSNYFDPFTGLPMLWSSTQKKIYSVGRDRFDDGGDTTFDISVPAVVTTSSPVKETPHPSASGRSRS